MLNLKSDPRFIKGFWWRPSPGHPVRDALQDMSRLGVTDVWVWWEPFHGHLAEWQALRAEVQSLGIRFHMWVTVNHHYAAWGKADLEAHPEWAAVDRDDVSVLDKPFAGFQYWFCPSDRDRWDHEIVRWADAVDGTDGLHLDYIRYPDGFRFGESPAVSRQEVPEQSYCYCGRCRSEFQQATGFDPMDIPFDTTSPRFRQWQSWRQHQIDEEVSTYQAWLARSFPSLALTAAVFPTPQIARDNVQQDWAAFSGVMDAVCPMIYAKAYWEQPVTWVQEAVELGLSELTNGCKLIAGLGPLDGFSPGEIKTAVECATAAGAHGTVWFLYPLSEPWQRAELEHAWAAVI